MKKLISVILIICMMLSVMTGMVAFAHPFSDSTEHWASSEIDVAYQNGIISGDENGNFNPEAYVTRAEFVKMLAVYFSLDDQNGVPEIENSAFWAQKYSEYLLGDINAENLGYVSNSDGTSVIPGVLNADNADVHIERWEAANIMWDKFIPYCPVNQEFENLYTDAAKITARYDTSIVNPMIYCAYLGLVNGDENGNFNADQKLTRAEAVTFANRFGYLILQAKAYYRQQDEQQSSNTVEATAVPQTTENPELHSFVQFEMEDGGKFTIELYPEYAPETVQNFLDLAGSGFYDGLTFHRVIKDFMAQGGDPEGTGAGGSGKTIKGEFASNGFAQNTLSHKRGTVSMARSSDPDSASSQFFICYSDDDIFLDGQYAAFGKVIEGMDVVDSFLKIETDASDKPVTPIVIKKSTIIKK